MDYVRACLHLIAKLSIRHNDQSCVVALHEISIADHVAQRAECDVCHLGPRMVGDGGAKMLLDSIAGDLDRAYQALD